MAIWCRAANSSSSPRADTIMGVTFCAVAAEHPLAQIAAAARCESRRFHRGNQTRHGDGSRFGHDGKKGVPTGLFVTHPLTQEKVESGSATMS